MYLENITDLYDMLIFVPVHWPVWYVGIGACTLACMICWYWCLYTGLYDTLILLPVCGLSKQYLYKTYKQTTTGTVASLQTIQEVLVQDRLYWYYYRYTDYPRSICTRHIARLLLVLLLVHRLSKKYLYKTYRQTTTDTATSTQTIKEVLLQDI